MPASLQPIPPHGRVAVLTEFELQGMQRQLRAVMLTVEKLLSTVQ